MIMKTTKEIMEEMQTLVDNAKERKKKRPNLNKYVNMIKVVKTSTEEQVIFERQKLVDELKKINDLWPEYLKNFTAFRLKYDDQHEIAVKKEFNKVFGTAKLRSRIKDLDYLLNK